MSSSNCFQSSFLGSSTYTVPVGFCFDTKTTDHGFYHIFLIKRSLSPPLLQTDTFPCPFLHTHKSLLLLSLCSVAFSSKPNRKIRFPLTAPSASSRKSEEYHLGTTTGKTWRRRTGWQPGTTKIATLNSHLYWEVP